jgi:hypothetical protein
MGLFDAFSSSDENKLFRQGDAQSAKYTKKAIGYGEKYTGKGATALNTGATDANAALDSGAAQAAGQYSQSLPLWQQLSGMGTQGVQSYGDLIGLGGGDPAQMQAMLAATPGYQFQLDQGLEGLNRTANSRGMLTSGNNTQDILKYSQGLADQTYQSAVQNRLPYFGMAQNAAQGQTGVYNQLGNLYDQLGANKANVATGTGSQLANLYQGQGQLGAQAYTNRGQDASGMYTNMANAGSAADANLWGAILGGVGGLASAYAA